MQKTLGEIMAAEPAGGYEGNYAHTLKMLDEQVSASRGLIALLLPPGKDFALLSESDKLLVRGAQDCVDKALAVRHATEQKRAEVASIPTESALVKSAGFGVIAERLRVTKSRFDDAVAGRLGKLNFAEQQRIRLDYSKAEAAFIDARYGRA